MKPLFLLIFLILGLKNLTSAQPDSTKTNDSILGLAEVGAEFPGGMDALYKYISTNQQYPVNAKNEGIQGKVYVQFIIDETGNVTDAKAVRGLTPELDNEALRLIKNMPKWKPGTMRGKPVKMKYTIPIVFKLN